MTTTQQIYYFVRRYIEREGLPPTIQEIAQTFQLSPQKVEDTLVWLERRRKIVRLPGKARGIRLPEIDRRWWMEEQVWSYLEHYHRQWGKLPSLHQAAEGCGLGIEVMTGYIYQLYANGRINGLAAGGISETALTTVQSA